jgi:HD-GYP domain-containing protein (c-di-GMP phosphodiesterase class II)
MADADNGLTKIHVYELRIGMCVCQLDIPIEQSPFLFEQIDITSQAEIKVIQDVCNYVYIDVKRQKRIAGDIPTRNTDALQQFRFARSFEQTAKTFKGASHLIKTVMDDIRFGNQFSVAAVKQAVAECVEKVVNDADAMLLLTQLKDQDQYTAQHSMNVCIMSILLGRELQMPVNELNQVGVCGLMHDIGKMKVPLEVLNKPGKLSADELAVMHKHTVFGRDILMSARNIYPGAVDVAYSHHERLVGGGYPRGVDKTALSAYTKIVAVVDAYDAITSDRVYQTGKPHLIALGILVNGMSSHFEANFVTRFINCIGFYPQGNMVELSNGEIGIVFEQNKADRLKPKILIVLDAKQLPTEERILDLSLNARDSDGQPFKIKKVSRPQDYRFDLNAFYQQGKFTKPYPVIN